MALLEIRNVVKQFADFTAVNHVSLSVEAGEFFTLLGPSGCGKTTLLRLIAAQLKPASGEVWVNGQNLPSLSRSDLFDMRKQFGVLFGFGYDDSQLQERRHPTRDDLDAVSRDLPIAVIHQSGHFGALNSAALARAGIGPGTPNPEGGVIRRRAGSQVPNGVLEDRKSVV